MKLAGCRAHLTRPLRRCPAGRLGVLVAALTLCGQAAGGGGKDGPAAPPPTPAKKLRPADILCVDGSAVKGTLLDSHLELVTPYGKLLIPVADVRKIEFRTRLPEGLARRIQAAVAGLGHAEFKRRAAATDELRALQEKAYPALLRAARAGDSETARRAAQLLAKLRETIPEERLEARPHDVVHTEDSVIAGRLTAASLKVKTVPFGVQQLKVADVRTLATAAATAAREPANLLPDPGTLSHFQHQAGKTLVFKVTGAPAGSPGAWGTDVYTADSVLAVAAVHAGVLRPGQTGAVRVTVLGAHPNFQGSVRNGITSGMYGPYAGYRINR